MIINIIFNMLIKIMIPNWVLHVALYYRFIFCILKVLTYVYRLNKTHKRLNQTNWLAYIDIACQVHI